MTLKDDLFKIPKDEYGKSYTEHFLEQYKLFVESTDRISNRRLSANSFFLTINTVIVGLVGYVNLGDKEIGNLFFLISIAGIILNFTWYRMIRSYYSLNSGKFKVIHEIEKNLPLALFYAEWKVVGNGKDSKKHLPFTKVEKNIPWVFLVIHLLVFIYSTPWNTIAQYLSSC